MKNLKADVVAALKSDATLTTLLGGPRIYFQFPPDPAEFPRITYYEADNKDFPFGDDMENATEVILVVDIWNTGSTSDIAASVDRVMNGLGFYREFSADLYEDQGQIHHKTMRFRKLKVFDGTTGVIPVDPWLEALAKWTETELGAGWTVYRNPFPEGYNRPAVIWILTRIATTQESHALYRVEKRFTGLVITDIPMKQISGGLAISEGLTRDIKIPLDVANKRYLTVRSAPTDVRSESLTFGRVSVELYRFTSRPSQDVPIISAVKNSPTLQ